MGQVRPFCGPVALRQYFIISIYRALFPTSQCRISCYSLPDDSAHALLSTSLWSFCAPLSHLPAAVDYLPFELAVAILYLNSSPIPIRYLNDIGFVRICYALLATSRGHAFVLTIDLSRLDEHNEKTASLLVP